MTKPVRVLSLFDGISCGMVALERAGIPVERYAAFETDKFAVAVSEKNYPQIEHYGNVFEGDFTKFKGFDLLIGGSPCTYWSVAKTDRETTCDGEGFKLFMEYVRALRESGCRYFLYENNYSIHKNIKDEISRQLGVQPIMINSARVSAQHRKRCYWTNIPNVIQPEDKGIYLKDIIDSGISWQDKSYCITACYHPTFKDCLEKHRNTLIAEPIPINDYYGKAKTIKAQYAKTALANAVRIGTWGATMIAEPIRKTENTGVKGDHFYSVKNKTVSISDSGSKDKITRQYFVDLPDGDYIIRKLTPVEAERLQTLPDNYTEGISHTQRYRCIGNGWTVDVISHILSCGKRVQE